MCPGTHGPGQVPTRLPAAGWLHRRLLPRHGHVRLQPRPGPAQRLRVQRGPGRYRPPGACPVSFIQKQKF